MNRLAVLVHSSLVLFTSAKKAAGPPAIAASHDIVKTFQFYSLYGVTSRPTRAVD